MNSILDLYRGEPTVINGAIAALVDAVIALVVQFGIAQITADQKLAIDGVVAAFSLLVMILVTRSQVTPTAKLPAPSMAAGGIVPHA